MNLAPLYTTFPAIWHSKYLMSFVISFLVSILFTYLSIIILTKFNVMDNPDPRKIHKTPIPRMGGIAIFLAFEMAMLLIGGLSDAQKGILIGSGIALAIGVVDDLRGVPATVKLACLFGMTLIIRHFGVVTNLPFFLEDYRGIFNIAITMLWLTGVCSAMNAIDHMDGLAGGIASIAALSYLAISIQTGQWRWGTISISLFGAILGFLVFNWHPAKIFMGDSGSFFLGFSLGSIGIMGGWSEEPLESVIIPFSILSIPVVDLVYVLVVRRFTGVTKTLKESIVYCGKDHIGHRFCQLGFSQANSVRIICLLSMTIAISALLIKYTENLQSILLLFQIFLVYIVVFILMKHPDSHKREI